LKSLFFWDVILHHSLTVQPEFFLDTSTPEDEAVKMSQNIGHQTLNTAIPDPRRTATSSTE
jgi:hypothetical protein